MKTMRQLYNPTQPVIESDPVNEKRGFRLIQFIFLTAFMFILAVSPASAQLGEYSFTGTGACPNQNTAVASQPAHAVFSDFSSVNTVCSASDDQLQAQGWNQNTTIDLGQYHEFAITADANYVLNLTSLSFTHSVNVNGNGSGTSWVLRSSIDNYAADLASGSADDNTQTPVITLSTAGFTGISTATFRLYLINAADNQTLWTIDDVTMDGSVVSIPADPANPTSNSPQCSSPGVTITANGAPPAGETWYWQTSATGTSTANSGSTYTVSTSGTYYIRSQDNTTLAWSNGAGSVAVVVTPDVTAPVFSLGANSIRCQGAGTVSYAASAANTTGITYTLDATSLAAGNTINSSTGDVTYKGGWNGTSTITAIAAGCNGPQTSTHIASTYGTVGVPVFTLGSTSTRCQSGTTVSYTANATNTTGITYSLDAASLASGNTINSSTGDVTYAAGWGGTSTITASAAGCPGPKTSTHRVTTTPSVGTPVFTLGTNSTRCQGAGTITYAATATNTTGITYSLDATSLAGGNTINSANGTVTYSAAWNGTSTITASAAGCNGPITSTHIVTVTPTVGVPVFSMGSTSTRCLGASTIAYTATATNNTGITYSLDAASILGGNTINSSTGVVTYSAIWIGTTTITAKATGCNGPKTATHVVTITASVSTPVFVAGSSSTRCQGAGIVTYAANAANSSGITYTLDAASLAGGNTINSATGDVTYMASWNGTSIITASAAGCSGPKTATHTVTINAPVSTPVFSLGTNSGRCQGGGTITYTATAAGTTGIIYSLDAASTAGGNTINSTTGDVTYAAGWVGTSTITATASGCSGPKTATHTIVTTATVGTPIFTLGSGSTRCQGAATVTYTANASNSSGITYSLDAASISAGNTINSTTGTVSYVAGWSGVSVITASATGCNGPKTSTHTVTITPSVGVPVFALGIGSTRLQGAGIVTYTATASNTSGITYSLDAASITGGNSINTSTGAVTYAATWNGTSIITASAAGCNGPQTSTHTVTINATSVIKQLYLSDPAQALDRVDPVSTADATTSSTAILSSTGTTSTTFTMAPALCSDLTIKAGTITVRNYVTVSTGAMPVNPNITAVLSYGATNIITLTNPVYNSGTNLLTWTGVLGADVTVPAGQAISLKITTAQAAVTFKIDFDSQTKPSRIDLPVSTFINVTSLDVYTAAYPGGTIVTSGAAGSTKYIRATVTDPFGTGDITAMNINISPTGATVAATSVATSGCSGTYEYVWTTPSTGGTYSISAIAKEGFENTVTNSKNINFDICSACPPVALNDSASGAGGTPIVVNVLANDYDPNNNLNSSSLAVIQQPKNGSAYLSNNTIIYLPNGAFSGKDTLTYQVCDNTSPSPLCATAQVFFDIDPLIIDVCGDASKTHTYYIPYPEQQSYTALLASSNTTMPSNNIRTIISIKVPYPGMKIYWDEWEDGYEANILSPTQSTTKVWGDGNPYNGIAPGYPNDIIPAGGSIILDNTMVANPRNPANIYYDGRDKIVSSGQIAVTQVSGEPTRMPVQAIKTNVTSTYDFGQSFTIPLGQNFNSQDFKYTALFIRASQDNTTVSIDKDNNGTLETTTVLNEGQCYFVNGGVLSGATVTSDKPVGVELNAGGVDQYSIRNAPIYPATWYSNTYYTPVPTSDNAGDNPKDTSVVMFYNSLNRPININWNSGVPANGVINVPAKSTVRFPLAYSTTAAYKFVNPTGESFTAIEIVDSYTPGGGGNDGSTYDWSFNLISEARLTDYATVAWAPGGLDLVAPPGPDVNGNPIWVTPSANTTIYVKYDGNISGSSGLVSPCGLKYDVSYSLNALHYLKIKDPSDNDQSGIAIYTCNGAKIAAVYGEDPQGSSTGIGVAYWDVGSTIQPFCKQKLVVAEDDYATTLVSQPVTIPVVNNDFGFLATIDPSTVTTLGVLQPKHGTVSVNGNGTILYTPNVGYVGVDTFEYNVCSTPAPIVCDLAMVIVKISTCGATGNLNVISGQVFIDKNKDGVNNDGGTGFPGGKVYLYTDGNCSGTIDVHELTDSVVVDNSGFYQFTKYPEKTIKDDFDGTGGTSTCASGSDGDSPWAGNWVDSGDPSVGFCNASQSAANTDVEIVKDAAFGFALRLKDNNVSATRSVNLTSATKAFLTFSYRRKSATLVAGSDILVQASSNGSTFTTIYTIAGDGNTDASYVTIYNQDITSYISGSTAIRFLTNNNVGDADTVYIDDVTIKYLKYPLCYITQLASSSVPANYYITTATQNTMSISSGGTCTSQFDFGVTKSSITVSGTLYNDKNGLVDGAVNGTVVGSPGGSVVYAYLADTLGNVAFKTIVNSGNGSYSFTQADVNTKYTLMLSTTNAAVLSPAPVSPAFNAAWAAVGDAYGTNNVAGTGNESGTPNAAIAVKTGLTNVTNVNFGIERLPNSDDYIASINQPTLNEILTLNGAGMNPPVLSGSDPEDCTTGCILAAKNVIIDSVPANAQLYYNNALVTNGQLISNFNSNLFQIKFIAATLGSTSVIFNYSYVDAANMKDPTPATYKLLWFIALPADGFTALASLDGTAANITWTTLSEQNTSHFVVERSLDGMNFTETGNAIPAAGNSVEKRDYQEMDNISNLMQNSVIYYRVKLVDINGKMKYSNMVSIKLFQKSEISAWPNPFQSSVTIGIRVDKETTINIRLADISGKVIKNFSQQVTKGLSQIVLHGMQEISAGVYMLEVTDEKSKSVTVEKLIKN